MRSVRASSRKSYTRWHTSRSRTSFRLRSRPLCATCSRRPTRGFQPSSVPRRLPSSKERPLSSSSFRSTSSEYSISSVCCGHSPSVLSFGANEADANTTYLSLATALQHTFSRGSIVGSSTLLLGVKKLINLLQHITSTNASVYPAIDPACTSELATVISIVR